MSEPSGSGNGCPKRRYNRGVTAVACLGLLVAGVAPPARAYFEDLDSPSPHSTFHYELTRLLARAAGFSAADAELIAVADQTVDLLTFAGEPEGSPAITIDGTSRYAEVTAKYFHFPRRGATTGAGTGYPGGRDTCANFTATDEPCAASGGEIRELELWAMTGAASLSLATPTVSIDGAPAVPVAGATPVALGIYLHSLADSYSHEKCGEDAHARRHCLPSKSDCPVACTTEIWHGQSEYGEGGAGVSLTKEAGRATWQELNRFRVLRAVAGAPLWDDATATAFIDSWAEKDRAAVRRDLALDAYESIATCSLTCAAGLRAAAAPALAVDFETLVTATTCSGAATYTWSFGDGSTPGAAAAGRHAYPWPGAYEWTVEVAWDGALCAASGTVVVPAARLRQRLRPSTAP